ncbi:hypothetical protein [Nitratireductor sp. StC3]|uniref:hypothetical protein n=1 Tax=Nitratireductor sp. StC3 TaxID=2126741 RepID=UPI000D0D580B|nr:hypothetical protein [Nitratireductor sp. StC3]PSM18162.1 hypothetical protein C7T96_09800 [Nitratireductor sp. StC3]
MTNIIQFHAHSARRKPACHRRSGSAAIIVFPGIRYERQGEALRKQGPADTPKPSRRPPVSGRS